MGPNGETKIAPRIVITIMKNSNYYDGIVCRITSSTAMK